MNYDSSLSVPASLLVSGGAGFIGSNFVLKAVRSWNSLVGNFDKLTYAGNLDNLADIAASEKHVLIRGDLCERNEIRSAFQAVRPQAVIHFAAESHVDRSIHDPEEFVRTNVLGTFHLLDEARNYWKSLALSEQEKFRFLHVSTDEVYGSLEPGEPAFTESSPYAPNSPYSASKAAADHMVRAYHKTFGLPTLTTNCSNNYGPFQFPEKLIPLMIHNALAGKALPVYGDGGNLRDWLYVDDHCNALAAVLVHGRIGETYNIGGGSEKSNLDVVRTTCRVLDELRPGKFPSESLITFVADRPGHDHRYAIDFTKIQRELGWHPQHSFESGLRRTIQWYLDHQDWVQKVVDGSYQNWVDTNYARRAGTGSLAH